MSLPNALSNVPEFPLTRHFLSIIDTEMPLFAAKIRQSYQQNEQPFSVLAEKMLGWGKNYLADELWHKLTKGYCAFVSNVNRSQMQYEMRGSYEHSSYQQVYDKVYDNQDFMELYHWGVYVTTFAWQHHLALHEFFELQFLAKLPVTPASAIDLGSGSGIWSLLLADHFTALKVHGVDISKTSISHASRLAEVNGFGQRVLFHLGDATSHQLDEPCDIGISCFLIEHLEQPEQLLLNLAANIADNGYAFVTAALSAAEIDHIYEIRYESELLQLAEKAGFRVISSFSSAAENYPQKMAFLPRSMAMVLQKRHNEIW